MKPDDLLDALENMDDIYIKKAKMPRKPIWKTAGIIAASITLLVLLGQLSPLLRNLTPDLKEQPEGECFPAITQSPPNDESHIVGEIDKEENDTKLPDGSAHIELGIEEEYIQNDIWIYYVEGNGLKRTLVQDKRITFSELFDTWKEKNGIGEEVLLSNASVTDTKSQNIGSLTIAGNYFVMKVEVSSNLQEYFKVVDSENLLESLEKTMLTRTNYEIKEYILTLK